MKITQKDIDKLSVEFAKWKGSNASINSYRDDHDRLVIGFERAENPRDFVGFCFTYCVFLSGPTRWKNCNLKCKAVLLSEGNTGFEVWDEGSGFLVRCEGSIVVGGGAVTVPN